MKQNEDLNKRFLKWLRPEGIEFFKGLIEKHGTVLAIWNSGGIPHSVHFREGMQVRNWMRDQPEFADNLDDHWLDNNWAEFTERVLRETE
jgi:hypothetical protein